jgi:aminobenzoyl-glutamate utilization protein B
MEPLMKKSLANSPSLATGVLEDVASKETKFCELSDAIWGFAEVGFEEHRSALAQIDALEQEGFTVTKGIGGISTAFVAEAGSGGTVVALLGEFDALAGMSQQSGLAEPLAVVKSAPGHGCGHNLLGTGAALAAAAVAKTLAREGLPGRVRYYGCPAEEGGAGKAFMVRAGAFAGVDVAFTWHPAAYSGVNFHENLAFLQASVRFKGKSSHAALSPHLGRSALDAVELMNVGVNYLREHLIPDARVHYAYRDAGGRAANVVQATAEVCYIVRAPTQTMLGPIFERVRRVAEGAALMTDTTVEVQIESGMSNPLLNKALGELLYKHMANLGTIAFDANDLSLADRFVATLSSEDQQYAISKAFSRSAPPTGSLHDAVIPFDGVPSRTFGSTDVGDVSWVVPTAQFWGATCAVGTAFHSWQMVAQGTAPFAHKGMVRAARVLALAALDALSDPDLVSRAKQEWKTILAGRSYVCPIPAEVMPPSEVGASRSSELL